ncbi:MAG TPA: MgtC/SapB family protein [Pyrinomonadaceae bacterium]|jgi:putative Mg2+ transporter-C (MgtC) family protein
MEYITQLEIIGEVALAMFLGSLIGVEREFADKPAGFRTQMLVAGASALLVGLGDALMGRYLSPDNPQITADPIRIVEAIVTGISFLGAGTIFRSKEGQHVEGLTTAASILLCAAIGISVAVRQFVIAVGVTILALIVLRLMAIIEKRIAAARENAESKSD